MSRSSIEKVLFQGRPWKSGLLCSGDLFKVSCRLKTFSMGLLYKEYLFKVSNGVKTFLISY